MKALILAAGRGERLRPLTDETPKPLLPLAGAPLIVHHIKRLTAAGISEIIINVSYQADKITKTLGDGRAWGAKLTFSYEPTALESGGAVLQALPLLGNSPFIVMSADIFTDYPFQQLMKSVDPYLAHLVLASDPNFKADFHLQGDVLQNHGTPKYTYANMGCYHPHLFAGLTPHRFPLGDLLRAAVDKQQLSGELYQGIWENVTSPAQYAALQEKYGK